MISHEETMRLIALAQQGDEQACTTLIVENTPLVKSIVKRYLGKSVEYDDLLQIAHIGLLKAIKNFSAQYDVKFSTYAVPMILGELKRYMRDEGYIKVSRTVKSLAAKIMKYTEELCQKGETADVEKIARHFDTDVTEVVFALDAMRRPVSLYETTSDKEGKETALVDKLALRRGQADDIQIDTERYAVQAYRKGKKACGAALFQRYDSMGDSAQNGRFAGADIPHGK